MATHSSVLAWRIPGTAEPGGLPSMGSHRVGHDWSHLAVAEIINNIAGECMLSHVRLFATPWTVPARLFCPWNFPGNNTEADCHFLLQGIFLTQGWNTHPLHFLPVTLLVKNPPANAGDTRDMSSIPGSGRSPGHSSILARKIPWIEEPGRLQSIGPQRVRHDWAHMQTL